MGLFDFVKNAGAKIGIGKSTSEEAAEKADKAAAAAASRAKAASRAEDRKEIAESQEKVAEARKSFELEKHVKSMGFEVEDLDVTFDDGKATVKGAVEDAHGPVFRAIGGTQQDLALIISFALLHKGNVKAGRLAQDGIDLGLQVKRVRIA